MNVGIFIPCFIDQIYPETGHGMVRVLEKAGVHCQYNPAQTCCGQVAFNNGYWEEAKCLGEKFIRDFMEFDYVVGPSASCISMVKNYYPDMFANSAWHNENKFLGKKMIEFTHFLVDVLHLTDLGARFEGRVCYHDSCAGSREYGLKDEGRLLLSKVEGLELVEMSETDVCCGFGGTFSIKHEAISTAMALQKLGHAVQTGASWLVSTEASCLMHLEGVIKKHDMAIRPIHIAELLARGLDAVEKGQEVK